MTIQINEELRTYIDPLSADEYEALERSLLAEGCRDALVLWGDVLVDGHNRYALCTKHGIEFKTTQNTRFKSMDDVRLWMIENHLGRRSVSDFQRGVLALRKKEILQQRQQELEAQQQADAGSTDEAATSAPSPAEPVVIPNRQALARAARVSSNTLGQIEKIQKEAAPELVRAVKSGEISINAAAAVAEMPVDKQIAAAAEGRKALKELARQAREAKAKAKAPSSDTDVGEGESETEPPVEAIEDYPAEVARLRRLVAALTEERDSLKKKVMHLTVALSEARQDK
ncbi:hypothetical protein [Bordetella genomosp. 4]|uniref:Plasmid replication/partition related protein n=1 Tax=Bordetella genomosp. 4 TaxID=463044 RepID=A0A261TZP2_9BORD|nr:hypothetical protein [Bordetella genomosp. 4]OZI51643.1 hypothetical protein CAL21_06685 [Bordetella genomosp. 4]OZI54717.1 hypothetical protein CAL20_16790 [Bordetella genomosp. 4]